MVVVLGFSHPIERSLNAELPNLRPICKMDKIIDFVTHIANCAVEFNASTDLSPFATPADGGRKDLGTSFIPIDTRAVERRSAMGQSNRGRILSTTIR